MLTSLRELPEPEEPIYKWNLILFAPTRAGLRLLVRESPSDVNYQFAGHLRRLLMTYDLEGNRPRFNPDLNLLRQGIESLSQLIASKSLAESTEQITDPDYLALIHILRFVRALVTVKEARLALPLIVSQVAPETYNALQSGFDLFAKEYLAFAPLPGLKRKSNHPALRIGAGYLALVDADKLSTQERRYCESFLELFQLQQRNNKLGGILHDVLNLLTSLRGFSEMIEDSNWAGSCHRVIEEAVEKLRN